MMGLPVLRSIRGPPGSAEFPWFGFGNRLKIEETPSAFFSNCTEAYSKFTVSTSKIE